MTRCPSTAKLLADIAEHGIDVQPLGDVIRISAPADRPKPGGGVSKSIEPKPGRRCLATDGEDGC